MMTVANDDVGLRLESLLWSRVKEQNRRILKNKSKILVHYTSSSTLLNILQRQEVWMRNARGMNDFSEIRYARKLFLSYFLDQNRRAVFAKACNDCHKNSFVSLSNFFDGNISYVENQTYITCLSIHDKKKDAGGRLSMWRGYGGGAVAAAVVIKKHSVMNLPFGIIGVKVEYPDEKGFFESIDEIKDYLIMHKNAFSSVPADIFIKFIVAKLQIILSTTKHPGFREEEEWRLLYMPNMFKSDPLEALKAQAAPKGIPETIYKIPIGKALGPQAVATVDELVEQVIIGPCAEVDLAILAIKDALNEAKHRRWDKVVRSCGIPYRERI
ncbi:hypothetical protein Amn_19530 [Aminobacter sp. Y103A]|nr:hypothetical protein Amn_19530 [Aminobacter sp. SS-2016]